MISRFGSSTNTLKRQLVVDSALADTGAGTVSLVAEGGAASFSFKRLKGLDGISIVQDGSTITAAAPGIQIEYDRAVAREQQLQLATEAVADGLAATASQLITEQYRAAAAEGGIQESLDEEIAARSAQGSSLQNQISSLLNNTDAVALNSLAELVADYKQNGEGIDGRLTTYSTATDNRLTAVEETLTNHGVFQDGLQQQIFIEINDRTNAITDVYTALAATNEAVALEVAQRGLDLATANGRIDGLELWNSELDARLGTVEDEIIDVANEVAGAHQILEDIQTGSLGAEAVVQHELFFTWEDNTILLDQKIGTQSKPVYTPSGAANVHWVPAKAHVRSIRNLSDKSVTLIIEPFEAVITGPGIFGVRIGEGSVTHTRMNLPLKRAGEPLNEIPVVPNPEKYWPSPNVNDFFFVMQPCYLSLGKGGFQPPEIVPGVLYISSVGEVLLKRDNIPFEQGDVVGFQSRQHFSYQSVEAMPLV